MCLLVLEIISCFNNLICESAKNWLSSVCLHPWQNSFPVSSTSSAMSFALLGLVGSIPCEVVSPVVIKQTPQPKAQCCVFLVSVLWLLAPTGRAPKSCTACDQVATCQPSATLCKKSDASKSTAAGISGFPDVWWELLCCVSLVGTCSWWVLDEEVGIKWDRICFSDTGFFRDTVFFFSHGSINCIWAPKVWKYHFKDSEARSFMLNVTTPSLITPGLITFVSL